MSLALERYAPHAAGALPSVQAQHAEETAFLYLLRSDALTSPHFALRHLERLDNRLAAHIDGLREAGDAAWDICQAALIDPEPGELFAATVVAFESKRDDRIERLLALAEAVVPMRAGLVAALGWISAPFLQGTVKALLTSPSAFRRSLGIACCTMHRVDPGAMLAEALQDADPLLRRRAARAAGLLKRTDLLPACLALLTDEDPDVSFEAASAAALLGDRRAALSALQAFSMQAERFQLPALQRWLPLLPTPQAHEFLKSLARHPGQQRALVTGAGIVGDPFYVPWLIKQMNDPALARIAGEAFCLLTGVDLADKDLDAKPPQAAEDEEAGDKRASEQDTDLTWPDPAKVQAWWSAQQTRFPEGSRFFMGEAVTVPHCQHVLRTGYQRQRLAAARYLGTLQPETPVFECNAPTWRQKRWLSGVEP